MTYGYYGYNSHYNYGYSGYSSSSKSSYYNKYSYKYCKPEPKPAMKEYEFTAFSEADLGGNIKCGASFEMPAGATTCITVKDDDSKLSGDTHCNENANDKSGQTASIDNGGEAGNGGQIYAEVYHTLRGSDGKKYYLIEIEQEGTNDDYFTFYGDTPPAGVSLTVVNTCNLKSVSYDMLGAGPKAPENQNPDAKDDAATICADEKATLDVLANDMDADGDMLVITEVEGQAIAEGQSITLASGATVTLEDGKLCFETGDAYDDLNLGEQAVESISYTVSDGNGGTSDAMAEVTICGVADTLAEWAETLPTGEVCFQLTNGYEPTLTDDAAYTMLISDASGDMRFEGITFEAAYCVSGFDDLLSAPAGTDITEAPLLKGTLHLATLDTIPAGDLQTIGVNGQTAAENLDMITWIMNQDFGSQGYNDMEIQGAIWALTDGVVFGGLGDNADVQEIVDLALSNGEGFEAGVGDIVGIYVDATPESVAQGHVQPFIIGVQYEDCIC
jgi:hypothetical protein